MSYSEFQKRCEDAAKHFLQSVVVIDNQAELYEGEWERSTDCSKKTVLSEKEKTLDRKPSSGLSKERINRATKPKKNPKQKRPMILEVPEPEQTNRTNCKLGY